MASLRNVFTRALVLGATSTIWANSVFAADLEGSLKNLVNAFTGKILPILAFGYLGKNIFSHLQGDPNAKTETIRVVVAIVCLVGITGVWNYISQQVR